MTTVDVMDKRMQAVPTYSVTVDNYENKVTSSA